MEVMTNDVAAIRMAVAAGIVTQKEFLKGLKDVGEVGTSFTKNAYKELANTGAVRDTASGLIGDMKTLFLELTDKNKTTEEAFKNYTDNLSKQGVKLSESLQGKAIKILEASRNELDNSNSAQRTANKVYDTLLGGTKVNNLQGSRPGRSLIEGNRTTAIKETVSNSGSLINQSSRLTVDGKADFNVNIKQDPQDSLTAKHKEEVSKIVLDVITSTIGQQYFVSLNSKDNPTKASTGKTLVRAGATG